MTIRNVDPNNNNTKRPSLAERLQQEESNQKKRRIDDVADRVLSDSAIAIPDAPLNLKMRIEYLTTLENDFFASNQKTLNLSGRRRTTLADLGAEYPFLTSLNLSNNLLTKLPDFNLSQLRDLRVMRNQLLIPPRLENCPQLQYLDLSMNCLTDSPDVRANGYLLEMNLALNELENPSDVGENPSLEDLDLYGNLLKNGPDVGRNRKLKRLDLRDNLLTELHDSVLSLPTSCRVYAGDNSFSDEYIQEFLKRLEEHRATHADEGPKVSFASEDDDDDYENLSLEDELRDWSQDFEAAFLPLEGAPHQRPDLDRLQLDGDIENQKLLARFLSDLHDTPDYLDAQETQKNIILQVEDILQLACDNTEFRKDMLALVREGSETCVDRVLLVFNRIEILCQFYQKLNEEEYKQLAIRAQRYELLEQRARRECEVDDDEIEAILCYTKNLRISLDLPITTQFMAHEDQANVSQKMLDKAEREIKAIPDDELLAHSGYWLSWIRKKFPQECTQIDEHFVDLLEEAREYFDLEMSQREDFLKDKAELAKLLEDAREQGHVEYTSFSRFLSPKKEIAIFNQSQFPTPSGSAQSLSES